jgi:hypothetical protein
MQPGLLSIAKMFLIVTNLLIKIVKLVQNITIIVEKKGWKKGVLKFP